MIQWHFSTSWVVTFRAALTLQSRRFKFCVACTTHYACLGDSLSVLKQCAAVVVQFLLFRNLRFFIVCLLINFLQALVHWCANESCFVVLVQSSTISLAWVSIRHDELLVFSWLATFQASTIIIGL